MHFLTIALCVSVAFAEPPSPVYSNRYSSVSTQRPSQAQVQPLGVQFARQEVPQVYYIPPDYKYNPTRREPTTTEADIEKATTERSFNVESDTEPESEQINSAGKTKETERLSEGAGEESFSQQGTYYIYHPSGLLQRIAYATKNDNANMGFTAQLRYQDVEPITDPIYTYDPNTFILQPLQV